MVSLRHAVKDRITEKKYYKKIFMIKHESQTTPSKAKKENAFYFICTLYIIKVNFYNLGKR